MWKVEVLTHLLYSLLQDLCALLGIGQDHILFRGTIGATIPLLNRKLIRFRGQWTGQTWLTWLNFPAVVGGLLFKWWTLQYSFQIFIIHHELCLSIRFLWFLHRLQKLQIYFILSRKRLIGWLSDFKFVWYGCILNRRTITRNLSFESTLIWPLVYTDKLNLAWYW